MGKRCTSRWGQSTLPDRPAFPQVTRLPLVGLTGFEPYDLPLPKTVANSTHRYVPGHSRWSLTLLQQSGVSERV